MSTPFTYPNGDRVDVFLKQDESLLDTLRLSDFGQTAIYLRAAQIRLDGTSRKKEVLADIISQLGVDFSSGDLFIRLAGIDLADISGAVMRLSQACVRVSDFATHQRLRSSNPFRDDVEEFFEAQGFSYVPDVKVSVDEGLQVRLDFEVKRISSLAYVLTLGAMNDSAAHTASLEIFRKWYDLKQSPVVHAHKFVTIYNSGSKAIKPQDLRRLADYSEVLAYPEQSDLLATALANGPDGFWAEH